MGIPSYFSHIVKSHRNIIKQFNNKTFKVNNLYLDSNSIVYDAIHNMDSNNSNTEYSDCSGSRGDNGENWHEYMEKHKNCTYIIF